MAISTYAELTAAISDFLDRDDLTASALGTFVDLAHAKLNRDLRHWRMEARGTVTLSSRYTALPADWIETIRFTVTSADGERPLRLLGTNDMQQRRYDSAGVSGEPMFYAHVRNEIEVLPAPDGSYSAELYYYEKIPAIASGTDTNWLLTSDPDAYLYGALTETAGYLVEDERMATWQMLYGACVGRLNEASDQAKWSGTGLRMKQRNG